MNADPHRNQPIQYGGAPLRVADAAVVLLHGRGATARSILGLGDEFHVHGVAQLAPQAAHNRWYPQSFLAPLETNEPDLSSALDAVDRAVTEAVDAGLSRDEVVVGGFSQGACLAVEYAARNPRRYGGVFGLSGGLIGPQGTEFTHSGDLEGTPVFLGCSDVDPHIPVERVHESRDVMRNLGGDVTTRIYPGMAHTVNDDEVVFVTDLLTTLAGGDDE